MNSKGHILYKRSDLDAPDSIKDANGDIVLGLCKRCNRGEAELEEPCTPKAAQEFSTRADVALSYVPVILMHLDTDTREMFAKVLQAARLLPALFTISELVETCWMSDKLAFGLEGKHLLHPSDKRVQCELYGKKGLIAEGFLAKHDDGRLSVRGTT